MTNSIKGRRNVVIGFHSRDLIQTLMTAPSTTLSEKEILILDCALKLLIEAGDAGLTLRKIAECSGMRLSNVQYYFASRDDVLLAMIARYFDACRANLVSLTESSPAETPRERMGFLVCAGLSHGREISDMCRAFREIWALSSRSALIDECLMDYYRGFAEVVADYAFEQDVDAAGRARVATLLVPYFEGYSITARAMPTADQAVAEMLTNLAMAIVEDEQRN